MARDLSRQRPLGDDALGRSVSKVPSQPQAAQPCAPPYFTGPFLLGQSPSTTKKQVPKCLPFTDLHALSRADREPCLESANDLLEGMMEPLFAVLADIRASIDWRLVAPMIVTGATGVLGAWIGARGAVRAQVRSRQVEARLARASLAAALRGELLAYFETVERLRQSEHAQDVLDRLKAGESVDLPVLLGPNDEPMSSLVLASDFRSVGTLGPSLAEDVFRLTTLIGSLRATFIDIARGHYQDLSRPERIALLDGQLQLWREVRSLGEDLSRRLGRVAAS